MNICIEKKQYKEAITIIAETLDEIELYGVQEINLLPEWI